MVHASDGREDLEHGGMLGGDANPEAIGSVAIACAHDGAERLAVVSTTDPAAAKLVRVATFALVEGCPPATPHSSQGLLLSGTIAALAESP